jgi:FdhD protein
MTLWKRTQKRSNMSREIPPEAENLPPGAVEKVPIQRITANSKEQAEDIIVREFPLTIILNGQELVTLLCSPADLKYLAIGFLFSEGQVKNKDDIKRVILDEAKGVVRIETAETMDSETVFKRLITPGCGRGASFYSAADSGLEKVESNLTLKATDVFELMKEFQHRSLVFRATGGVHSAALCDNQQIIIFSEDIGRHNAIDKIFGQALEKNLQLENLIVLTSGRVSSEIIVKIARRKIPVLISKSAPTSSGVKLADELDITLVGFVRGTRMNVYTHDWRITN